MTFTEHIMCAWPMLDALHALSYSLLSTWVGTVHILWVQGTVDYCPSSFSMFLRLRGRASIFLDPLSIDSRFLLYLQFIKSFQLFGLYHFLLSSRTVLPVCSFTLIYPRLAHLFLSTPRSLTENIFSTFLDDPSTTWPFLYQSCQTHSIQDPFSWPPYTLHTHRHHSPHHRPKPLLTDYHYHNRNNSFHNLETYI